MLRYTEKTCDEQHRIYIFYEWQITNIVTFRLCAPHLVETEGVASTLSQISSTFCSDSTVFSHLGTTFHREYFVRNLFTILTIVDLFDGVTSVITLNQFLNFSVGLWHKIMFNNLRTLFFCIPYVCVKPGIHLRQRQAEEWRGSLNRTTCLRGCRNLSHWLLVDGHEANLRNSSPHAAVWTEHATPCRNWKTFFSTMHRTPKMPRRAWACLRI